MSACSSVPWAVLHADHIQDMVISFVDDTKQITKCNDVDEL